MKKINLEEILKKSGVYSDALKTVYCSDDKEGNQLNRIKNAMKEACKQILELAAENAYCSLEHPDDDNGLEESDYIVSKYSIINTINQIDRR